MAQTRLNWTGNIGGRAMRSAVIVGLVQIAPLGCSQALKPVFQGHDPPLVWPGAPEQARIKYLGSLKSSTDLGARPNAFRTLGEWLVGPPPPQTLYGPRSVVCTPDGQRVWIADPGGRCVHLFDLAGRKYEKFTRLGESQLFSPVGLCLGPDGSVYVCDSENVGIHRVRGDTGAWIESLRLPEDILRPVAVAYDPNAREVYVVDVLMHDIKVLSPEAELLRIIGSRGGGAGEFNFPIAITLDRAGLWVTDSGNHRVQGLTRAGEPTMSFGRAGDAPGDLALPKGIAGDADGNLYVVDGRFENVQVFDHSGRLMLVFGEEGSAAGEFWLPGGIFIDTLARIWICDTYNSRVQVFELVKVPSDDERANHAP